MRFFELRRRDKVHQRLGVSRYSLVYVYCFFAQLRKFLKFTITYSPVSWGRRYSNSKFFCSAVRQVRHNSCLGEIKFSPSGLWYKIRFYGFYQTNRLNLKYIWEDAPHSDVGKKWFENLESGIARLLDASASVFKKKRPKSSVSGQIPKRSTRMLLWHTG